MLFTLTGFISQIIRPLRDFLWSQASQVIQSYGSAVSVYGLIFLPIF